MTLASSSWIPSSRIVRPYSSAALALATAAQSLRARNAAARQSRSVLKQSREASCEPLLLNRDGLRRPRRVVDALLDDAHAGQVPVHLRQRLRVGGDALDVRLCDARQREQAVNNLQVHLADDVQPVAQQQVVVAVDGALREPAA